MSERIEQIGKDVRATLNSLHWQVRHHEVGQDRLRRATAWGGSEARPPCPTASCWSAPTG